MAPTQMAGTQTDTIERTDSEERLDDGTDGDRPKTFHYVKKEKIVESAVMGNAVVALCGKVWVPGRDPQKFPVCPTCKEIYETLKSED